MRPVCIGPANCEAATGLPWRYVLDHAPELGVEVIAVGTTKKGKPTKQVIVADALLEALQKRSTTAVVDHDEPDDLAEMRARIARAG